MERTVDISPQERALGRIRALSRPLSILITIALAIAVVVPAAQIVVILFFPDHLGSLRSDLSFEGWNVGLGLGPEPHHPGDPRIALESLGLEQRCAVAALAALCTACSALALIQLRALFVLYASGVVFAPDNIRRLKLFGLWLVAAAIAGNVSGRVFMWVTHATVLTTANAALTVVIGAMLYVIARVMELGREADLERKDFI